MSRIIVTLGLAFLWPTLVFSDQINVKVSESVTSDLYETYEAVGECIALSNKTFISQVSGKVTKVYDNKKPHVKSGEILLEIDGPQAIAEYKAATLSFYKDKELFNKRLVSESTLDKANAAFEKASQEYNNRIIKAPFDGTVGVIKYHVGDIVSNGDKLLSVTGENNVKELFVELPHNMINYVTPETKILVVDHNKELGAQITNISHDISENTGLFSIKIVLTEQNDLHNGEYAKIKLILNPHSGVTVPAKAIMNNNKGSFVFVVNKDNIVEQKQITVGTRFYNIVEVKSGLTEGEQVVIEGLTKITVGDKVETLK